MQIPTNFARRSLSVAAPFLLIGPSKARGSPPLPDSPLTENIKRLNKNVISALPALRLVVSLYPLSPGSAGAGSLFTA